MSKKISFKFTPTKSKHYNGKVIVSDYINDEIGNYQSPEMQKSFIEFWHKQKNPEN